MAAQGTGSAFRARLLRPRCPESNADWAFLVLPQEASAKLPRRGRTSIDGLINGVKFRALLEPDGKKGHWLKIDSELLEASGAKVGTAADFEIEAVEEEPEPEIPDDLLAALEDSPGSRATWEQTTTIARVDWVHWVVSAKKAETRSKRISDACDMLARGKKRVCCFDPSGFYSKALCAPEPEDEATNLRDSPR